jgi:phosphatidylserine/phosphatidylglycerophosphate/cardiolipin synthase-like enzyme
MTIMIIKILLPLLLCSSYIFGYDKLYFLPNDNKIAKQTIVKLIQNSKQSIKIAMYNISYNKFIKQLNKKAKEGIKVDIFYEKRKKEFHQNIKFHKTDKKLHTKIAIFDNKIVVFGSANWKKKSFTKNYEVINITDDINKVEKFIKFYDTLKK